MCLVDFTQKDARRLFKDRKSALLWKIVEKRSDNKLVTPFLLSYVVTSNGYFISNRDGDCFSKPTPDEKDRREVSYGIHVLTRKPTKDKIYDRRKLLRVRCYKKDLIAANWYQAVFSQIQLLDSDIKKYKTEIKATVKKEKKN